MAFLSVAPEFIATAATDLAEIGAALDAANSAAAGATSGVLAAGTDEVSLAVAALFGSYGQQYQALSAQVSSFHTQFVQALAAGAGSYASAEAAAATPLQTVQQQLLGLINAPSVQLTGRPLIGNGANGAAGSGANGGDAGWLLGDGGAGGSG
ncbi:PE family protein, partial [Mycobacterium intermedium]